MTNGSAALHLAFGKTPNISAIKRFLSHICDFILLVRRYFIYIRFSNMFIKVDLFRIVFKVKQQERKQKAEMGKSKRETDPASELWRSPEVDLDLIQSSEVNEETIYKSPEVIYDGGRELWFSPGSEHK